LLAFFGRQLRCVVALEACAGAHHWARGLARLGHDVRLSPPAYVKPFVKRQKNDAEAICEAAQRPTMRFVAVKSEGQQASALVFRARDLAVRQRTQLANALRSHMAELGWVAPKGLAHMARLSALIEDQASGLPEPARPVLRMMLAMLADLDGCIAELDREIARRAREDEAARLLITVPGIGPVTATALLAIAPAPEAFNRGRDHAARRAYAAAALDPGRQCGSAPRR
jgi:transposase